MTADEIRKRRGDTAEKLDPETRDTTWSVLEVAAQLAELNATLTRFLRTDTAAPHIKVDVLK